MQYHGGVKKINFRQSKEFEKFVLSLQKKDRLKLLATINSIQEHGLEVAISMKWVKKLEKNLYEIRSKHSSNIQRAIYFQIRDVDYYITHGFTKKTNKTPQREIDKAKRIGKQLKGSD